MESSGEYLPLPRLTEPIDTLNGIFLKRTFFLNKDFTKSVTVGIFKDRNYSLGVLLKGRHDHVYWSFDSFNQFFVNFSTITNTLREGKRCCFEINNNESIKVMSVFEIPHVFLSDEGSILTLNMSEWDQFISNLPLLQLELRELFYEEDLIKQFLCGGSSALSPYILNRLVCEVWRL